VAATPHRSERHAGTLQGVMLLLPITIAVMIAATMVF